MINRSFLSSLGIIGLIAGCSPTVKVEAPDRPIVINMNMKIEHTVKMAVKKDLEKAEKANPDVFD